MKHYTFLGPAVTALREQKGMSQVDLAAAAGVTGPYVSLIENGLRQPSSTVTLRIATALGVPFRDITRTKGYEGEEAETAKARAAFDAEQAAV